MKNFFSLTMGSLLLLVTTVAARGQAKLVASASDPEAAIRKSIDSYVAAFNQGDAKSLAAHWNKSGEYVTPTGEKLRGRKQLENDFAEYFTEAKGAKLELLATQTTLLSPNVAVETGIARVLLPEQEPTVTEYKAIHVKTPEGWKIDSIREQMEHETSSSHYEQLQSLEWMIGSWGDSDEISTLETTCRWTTNRNFIVRSFKVFIEDRVDFEGTQVIGWDPQASAIRSWLFDSDGGFGVGHWSETESGWTVRTLNVLPDGKRGSSTNVYHLVDENTLQFRSIGRQVDGELLPNIPPVTVSRVQE